MEKGIKSRRKILEVAFKLFAAYSYPDVSYSLLEEASGISRGSMVYYFNNKEGIFRAVLEAFLFNMGSAKQVPEEDRKTLKGFFNAFVDQVHKDAQALKPFRIPNLSDARFTIERSALQFVPEFREEQRKAMREDIEVWKEVIANAAANGEIRSDINVEEVAHLFYAICCGWLYSGIYNKESTEQKLETLRTLFESQYKLIANN
ncbi:MAG: TetR/AcrR family transcriptional regulator [Muribaculaceae bacterium]|nr:TetR/AcrR family transcriptional regulator [Muribaculaceae bacterium]MDE6796036.1 TetR/AcrR family transcriptional regulator [Muribaculaceae bacterium]